MLADKDRIFTNIYGWDDPGLKGAKKRGDWDKTAAILKRGHDDIIDKTIVMPLHMRMIIAISGLKF